MVKRSKPIVIKVTSKHRYGEINPYFKYMYLALGFICGILVMMLFRFKKKDNKPKKEMPITTKIKKSKNDKMLFYCLLPFGKYDNFIDKTLEDLEENIYRNGKNKIVKKELIERFINLQAQ